MPDDYQEILDSAKYAVITSRALLAENERGRAGLNLLVTSTKSTIVASRRLLAKTYQASQKSSPKD